MEPPERERDDGRGRGRSPFSIDGSKEVTIKSGEQVLVGMKNDSSAKRESDF
jgi:hypothetical protein